MSDTSEVVREAEAWAADDPSPTDAEVLRQLIEQQAWDELTERMGAPLEFGTAGLRGLVGAGRSRMNLANVVRATRGFADYLLSRVPDAKTRPVVVGRDARLTSAELEEATRGVLTAARIPVRHFTRPVPTPIVAYVARQLAASGAVCITASHNPPAYNGYKVYAEDAAQIAPPVDIEIARRIALVGSTKAVPSGGSAELSEAVPESLIDRYFAELSALRPRLVADRAFPIVYTPLHGVAGEFTLRALAEAGFAEVHAVPEQLAPDGHFPTLDFPNPEEPGALALAEALADEHHAELVLANDPDGDRLGVAVRSAAGRWVQLTGNQVGVLLADYLLAAASLTPQRLVISTIVSTPMTARLAEAYGARTERTLTGFKWIWRAALRLEEQGGVRYTFGFEEALGYSAGHLVRDKDGISAAVLFADLVAALRQQGQSVLERLQQLAREHGLWVSVQKSVTRVGQSGAEAIAQAMARLRAEPPSRIGERGVVSVTDYMVGAEARPEWLPQADVVELELEGGRVVIRPSGTEPKLKIYVDLSRDVHDALTVLGEESELTLEAQALADDVARLLGL